MSEHDTDTETEPPTSDADGDPPEPDVSPCYQAYLERNDYRPDTCTIYASVTAGSERDQWIKAWGDAFVSRDDAR
ncbi:hypothetical protein RBH26_05965 [Natronolimnohabitans sp. A-GB9]|uniref:DUF7511 domain-containing protein n=1 Tax=Natronolimnohabitans sp. A-GB9 TaxID=3069757 RepID=UPI0027B762C2|nr:hypothetical protein [Natronolimnohabitans sp. A-GB9]MDQ2050025.1 hypothetical protein [Natronolimnohabitans sp. A-GB9]